MEHLPWVLIFETPYIYNMLDGKQYPLLADGDSTWNQDRTELTFKIKPAARWSDGTPVTAIDAAYTFASHILYETFVAVAFRDYIDSVSSVDTLTVRIKAKLNDQGVPINPLMVTAYLSEVYVIQKAWTQKLEGRSPNAEAFQSDSSVDVVSSGPYVKYISNDEIMALVRNDNYWGQSTSMWGKLPAPKYLAHRIYSDNDAGLAALKAGEVDVSQQFIPNVQDLWLKDKLPISTYKKEAPYNICASLPSAFFNLKSYGLDNSVIRKAIAISVNYDAIIADAMTNQSPNFNQVPRSLMNPTPGEQALYDHNAVMNLQWAGSDIETAKMLLTEAGIVDTDDDGWREFNGRKLSYKAVCPNGWTDWQTAIEILASAGSQIGVEITPFYPEWADYQAVFTNGDQTEYDIFMVWTNGSGPSNPWARVRQLMSSEFAGTSNNWNGNWGGYVNNRIDQIINLIPNETDLESVKTLYTEAIEIYLTDIPSFTLMYRPDQFHTVNESVWKNYPVENDGQNIPPTNLCNGYGIAGLYSIVPSKPNRLYLPALLKQ